MLPVLVSCSHSSRLEKEREPQQNAARHAGHSFYKHDRHQNGARGAKPPSSWLQQARHSIIQHIDTTTTTHASFKELHGALPAPPRFVLWTPPLRSGCPFWHRLSLLSATAASNAAARVRALRGPRERGALRVGPTCGQHWPSVPPACSSAAAVADAPAPGQYSDALGEPRPSDCPATQQAGTRVDRVEAEGRSRATHGRSRAKNSWQLGGQTLGAERRPVSHR